ncbi:MAG: hypothetical protein COV36_07645 [Alphaproteobacteria bacterium CG11_big_fil_rev_8_21_14_0_20_44_7]|nr:MAG: hypothetical protein COV36_07645 [Alphaproteobacteria bacterium CG11_big_fil_rev_8_21_14_0_20_44_7]
MKKDKEKATEKPTKSVLDSALDWLQSIRHSGIEVIQRAKNLERTNMELGLRYLNQGNFFDAALRFRFVGWLNKNNHIAKYLEGKSYVYQGKFDKAIKPLQFALAADPSLEEARFFLAVCGSDVEIDRVPPSILIEQLENTTDIYESQIVKGANYHVNEILQEELFKYLGEKQGFTFLDLDCRSGDVGEVVLEKADKITGIEPSMGLIALARQKRVDEKLVYNELINKMGIDFLHKNVDSEVPIKYDIITITYSFLNYGSLDEYFALIARTLKPKGLLAFNISKASVTKGYEFEMDVMDFAHSNEYIAELADEYGFKAIVERDITYQSGKQDVFYLMEKK